MKHLIFGLTALYLAMIPASAPCWDGFDADTADLVEIIPDVLPSIGATVDVRNYETEETEPCLIESITRNRKTIEVVVKTPSGAKRTLVMEYR